MGSAEEAMGSVHCVLGCRYCWVGGMVSLKIDTVDYVPSPYDQDYLPCTVLQRLI